MNRLTALLLLLALPAFAAKKNGPAYDDGHGFGFGVTPWFHLGPSWVSTQENPTPEQVRHGLTVEATLQTLVTWERFGLGVVAGYFGSGGRLEGATAGVKLAGLQVLPLLMVNLVSRVSLYVKGGVLLLGAINDVDVPVSAARVGGGLNVIAARLSASDVAVSLDVTQTWLTGADPSAPLTKLDITSAQVGVSVTFDPVALD
ncbi:MAG: hypothetical protein IAE78_10105 [Myxococcus sp.]|nr:hypothetical protein [Myxococcus sp.]